MRRDEAEAFLVAEARLLDDNDLKAWLDLTTEDVVYWIPVNDPDADPTRHLSILHESKAELSERAFRVLESGLNHTQDPPSTTVRFVSNVEVVPTGAPAASSGQEVGLRCNTLLYEYRNRAARRDSIRPNLHAARCQYVLRREGAVWRIASKKVVLANLDGPLDAMCFFI